MLEFGLSSPLTRHIPGLYGTDFAAITAWSGLLAAVVLASVNHYLDANEIPMSADVPGRGRIPRERPEPNGLVRPLWPHADRRWLPTWRPRPTERALGCCLRLCRAARAQRFSDTSHQRYDIALSEERQPGAQVGSGRCWAIGADHHT